ncbi:isochorismate hydrolase [Bacillus sp. LEw-kw-24]|nr:Isochorismatase [Bacillus cereus Rock1-3]MDF9890675.1 isochorismate hydrolase [Bacillus sp. LEw-kw-24]MDH6560950.1 isochorismate hydrolase [Bacillus sp. LEw-kw-2]MDH8705346.1 isochorismate hydrolase [Stenotrophomonas sp. 1198]MDP9749079.1 isochorismate hydrolase [Bacillus thuringiensis]
MDGIEPFFIADAVADFSLDHHKQALEYASNRCAVTKTKNLLLKDLYKLKKDSSEFTLQNLRQ